VQETDVRRGFGDDLAIEFEHESQYPMSGRVRWPHIKDHLFADVVIVGVPQLRVRRDHSRHGIRGFNFARRKRHGRSYKVT
jgi:hypothetical protein